MAYDKLTWSSGEPITGSRMNHMEEGIFNANDLADTNKNDISTLNSTTIPELRSTDTNLLQSINDVNTNLLQSINNVNTNMTNAIQRLDDTIGTEFHNTTGQTITDKFISLQTDLQNRVGNSSKAWTELLNAGVVFDETSQSVTTSLADILGTYYTAYLALQAYQTPNAQDTIPGINGDRTIASLADRITHIYNTINNGNATINGKISDLPNIRTRLSSLETEVGLGAVSIGNRLTALDGNPSSISDLPSRNIKSIINELSAAHISSVYLDNSENPIDYSTLEARFRADETKIKNAETEISNAHRIGLLDDNQQPISDTLDLRFDDIDGGNKPSRTLPSIITEINAAHRNNNDTLDARFDAIDDTLNNNSITSRLNTVEQSYVHKTNDVQNDLLYDIAGRVLDARQGKALKDLIDTINNTIGTTDTSGLKGRIKNLEDEIDEANDNGTLDDRFEAIETELTNALTSSIVRTPGENDGDPDTDTTYNSLDERLEAIENHAANVRTDVNTIATELNMYTLATNTITDTNSRVDLLEANMVTMANEIGMLLNGEVVLDMATAITGATTRIDSLEEDINTINDTLGEGFDTTTNTVASAITSAINTAEAYTDTKNSDYHVTEINAAHRTLLDGTDTLDNRFDDIETRLDAIDTTNTGALDILGGRVSTIETDLNDETTGLKNRVTTLETAPKSATVIIAKGRIIYNNDVPTVYEDTYIENGTNIPITPSADVDYLFETEVGQDTKYFYWKYINNAWELISGGGGEGSSSGQFAATLSEITNPDINIDYFIGNNINGYIHYRYKNNGFIQILPTNLVKDVNVSTATLSTQYGDTDAWPSGTTFSGGLNAYAISDSNNTTNLLNDFVAVRNARINAIYPEGSDTPTSLTLQIIDTKGHLIEYPIVGGSGGSAYSIRFISTMANSTFTVPADDSYHTSISAKAIVKLGSQILDDVQFTGTIMYRLSTSAANAWNNSSITLPAITNDTAFNVDVSSILTTNKTTIVRISLDINTGDGNIVNRYIDYTITKTQISISSTFDQSSIRTTNNLIVPYTCLGINLNKEIHFKIDEEDAIAPIITSSHNTPEEVSISLANYSSGAHTLQIYFIAEGSVTSNVLNYYFIYSLDESALEPIIGMNAEKSSIIYGEELVVNYTAYTPGKETTDKIEIKLYTLDENENLVIFEDKIEIRKNVRVITDSWKTVAYPLPITPLLNQPEQPITAYIEITAYHYVITDNNGTSVETVYTNTKTVSVTINRFTNPNNYDFTTIDTRNILYEYEAYGKTNNSIDRDDYTYVYTANDGNNTEVTFHGRSIGFNWAKDGYVDGESLTISGGAEHTIDVPIFSTAYDNIPLDALRANDITQYGRTIEIEYEVQSATNLKANIIECMDPNTHAGFCITPNCCYLTNQTIPVDLDDDGFILNESSIAAAYLQTGTRIHLVFVIEPWSNTKAFDKTYHQCVNIYINGEFANSCPYERDDDGNIIDSFTTNATMRFGSDTCILKLYKVKLYNRGLTPGQVLQAYKMSPTLLYDRLTRFSDNDILDGSGYVNYEKAKKRYNCLLLIGPDPTAQATLDWPTISPFKGSKSPAQRKKKSTDVDYEGKTESGLIFTIPSSDPTTNGYIEAFNCTDKVPAGAPAYLGTVGAYCSSNNVQGTSSQKYPLHNLKVYLAKWQKAKDAIYEEDPETHEQILVSEAVEPGLKKVKYSLKGYDDNGNPLGTEESTLCWKADYMSTDHANTYNANIADGLFSDKLLPDWDEKKYLNTVYGVRCLLFQQLGDDAEPVFVGDGCLNNDKGNTKTYGLEDKNDSGNNTLRQKWEFTNNTSPLDVFKSDNLIGINEKDSDRKIYAKGAFECSYPDEGDLKDSGLQPNYNHLLLLLTWVNKRACYLDYSVYDEDTQQTTNYTVSDTEGTGGTYNGVNYSTERQLKRAIFRNEFEEHFNLNHVLTYYIFSEYVALCDNRAKNMFLRSEDIKSEIIYNTSGQQILNGNTFPDDGTLWNSYVDPNTGITNPAIINWATTGENHSTFAKWAPVLYDLDSSFGVENVGLITIKYNADWQYRYNNKEAFSGFDSVFWLMVEDTYADEIRTLAKSLYNNDLNFTNFYRQLITGNKNATCPALTNQDMILKYDIPWNEGFINYSKDPDPVTGKYPQETPLYKYIQRGTRSTQKTTFMRQRSMLLSSKYVSTEFTNSVISFRAGVLVTGADTLLQLTANQDLYPAIMFGDSNTLVRPTGMIINNLVVPISNDGYVSAGIPCLITTSLIGNSDTVKIVGASVLNDIGDLSKYLPYELKVSSGTNLKRLIIGSNAAGYINTSTEGIEGLSDCILLEEINVRNTTKISSLNLSGNGLIKKVYAGGSNITTISLPNGGVLNEIEYGPNTANITLLNQKSLTSFTYIDNNSHYNLSKLWVENTPNVPIVDILTKALDQTIAIIPGTIRGELKGGIRLVNIDIDLYPINGTQQENDAALDETTQFLKLLINDMIKGRYLDSTGTLSSDTTKWPHITGKIHITSIRNSLLAQLNEAYPELIIYNTINEDGTINNNVNNDFTIKYYNYGYVLGATEEENDLWLLFTDHLTGQDRYIDPTIAIDPITNKPYIDIPTKPDDEQYKYTFGSYELNVETNELEYVPFSGWKIAGNDETITEDTAVQGDTIFIAQYPTTELLVYTVNWYAEPNLSAIQTISATYGTDISLRALPEENNSIERVKFDRNTNTYKVFKGWDRPIGKLTKNTNIYAQWEISTIDNSVLETDINFNNLNAADIYALANINPTARDRVLEHKLTNNELLPIQMGHDFDYDPEEVTTINLLGNANKITLNGASSQVRIFNDIKPLQVFNSDWTIALDYKLLMDATLFSLGREFVLLSCYKNANSSIQGFKVSLNKGTLTGDTQMMVYITWGTATTNVAIDTITLTGKTNAQQYAKTYRNIIVLRHSAASPENLYIYHAGYNGEKYGNEVTSTTLSYNSRVAIDTPIILGGNYLYIQDENNVLVSSIEMSTTRRPAKAIIYWGKFWNADLGAKNCRLLAQWPHETEYFILTGYDNNQGNIAENTKRILSNTKLSFIAAQGFGDRAIPSLTSSGDQVGWNSSSLRTFCNNRIFKAFPMAFLSIIQAQNIKSNYYNNALNSEGIIQTSDYIFLASEKEINPNGVTTTDKDEEALRFWPWLSSQNVKAYIVSEDVLIDMNNDAKPLNALRYRFLGAPFTINTHIFYNTPDPAKQSWVYRHQVNNVTVTEEISVLSGDVWYTTDPNVNDNGVNSAYIYYTMAEINEGIYVDILESNGGWKRAGMWDLRTYQTDGIMYAGSNYFEKVNEYGEILYPTNNNQGNNSTRILCPGFAL